jgi:hypothetical protein
MFEVPNCDYREVRIISVNTPVTPGTCANFGSAFPRSSEVVAASDYEDGQRLQYSVKQILNEFGKSLRINFSDFNHILN